jgi:hypothetical protein
MLNHVTSAHGDSPECSENSGPDSAEESELEDESDKESMANKPRKDSSAVLRYKACEKTSKFACHDVFSQTITFYELVIWLS